MNILIYNGNGTCFNSVKQTFYTLKTILGHAYDVIKVDAETLQNEPWQENCSLIVIPGGRDIPYCHDLATNKIQQFVHNGGRYLGFSAGAYFASKQIEFEKGTDFQVMGTRELSFFSGTCRGTLFPGFVPNSDKGARAIDIFTCQNKIKAYYNGGGYFVGANEMENVKVLCTYSDHSAAGIQCKVGKGSALLFGFHPEYDPNLVQNEEIKKELLDSAPLCRDFLSQSLADIGLNVLLDQQDTPELTPIYLSSISHELTENITKKLHQAADSNSILADSNNTFHFVPSETSQLLIENLSNKLTAQDKPPVLEIVTNHDHQFMPAFNTKVFYEHLIHYRKQEWGGGAWYQFGNSILYADVITSTQTILDKNYNFSQCLPTGLVCLATHQLSGRGRGRNSWVSQTGGLQFSFIIRHNVQLLKAPVVFIQYLIALSIVESIRGRKGYEKVPLFLKWPNDIYTDIDGELKKVGGLLVNSSLLGDEFLLVVGCGLNLNNRYPTLSINDVISQYQLKPLDKQDLLAHALVTFERYYNEFCEKGMGPWFLNQYYHRWLHSDKLVTLTTHNDEKVRIVGITSDYGMLEAVSVTDPQKRFTLQPDGNSFDMLKGLIIKKT